MNKAEFIAAIAEKSGMAKADVEVIFSATFESLTEALVKQEKIAITKVVANKWNKIVDEYAGKIDSLI